MCFGGQTGRINFIRRPIGQTSRQYLRIANNLPDFHTGLKFPRHRRMTIAQRHLNHRWLRIVLRAADMIYIFISPDYRALGDSLAQSNSVELIARLMQRQGNPSGMIFLGSAQNGSCRLTETLKGQGFAVAHPDQHDAPGRSLFPRIQQGYFIALALEILLGQTLTDNPARGLIHSGQPAGHFFCFFTKGHCQDITFCLFQRFLRCRHHNPSIFNHNGLQILHFCSFQSYSYYTALQVFAKQFFQ